MQLGRLNHVGVATPTWFNLPNCITLSVTPAKAAVPLLVFCAEKEKRDSRFRGNDGLVFNRHFGRHAVGDEAGFVGAVVKAGDLRGVGLVAEEGNFRPQ